MDFIRSVFYCSFILLQFLLSDQHGSFKETVQQIPAKPSQRIQQVQQ